MTILPRRARERRVNEISSKIGAGSESHILRSTGMYLPPSIIKLTRYSIKKTNHPHRERARRTDSGERACRTASESAPNYTQENAHAQECLRQDARCERRQSQAVPGPDARCQRASASASADAGSVTPEEDLREMDCAQGVRRRECAGHPTRGGNRSRAEWKRYGVFFRFILFEFPSGREVDGSDYRTPWQGSAGADKGCSHVIYWAP